MKAKEKHKQMRENLKRKSSRNKKAVSTPLRKKRLLFIGGEFYLSRCRGNNLEYCSREGKQAMADEGEIKDCAKESFFFFSVSFFFFFGNYYY